MKRFISILLGVWIAFSACTEDDLLENGSVGDKEVWATLSFGHQNFEEIDISTRATLNDVAESSVQNLFVYVFDSNGNRLFSRFYDADDRVTTLPTTPNNRWTVTNRTSTNNQQTQGKVMVKSPTLTGGSIYVLANLNADQLNISADQLNTVDNLAELQALTVTLNQEITSRTGYFLMQGNAKGITISETGDITKDGASVTIPLVRLDAKVTVNVRVGTAAAGQEMKDFLPESWQVMRLPKGTKVVESDTDAGTLGYFDSPELTFESDQNGVKSFSFYMLESKKDTQGLSSYNQRDERWKNTDGSYDLSKGMWRNVSDDATYLVVKGRVQMEVNTAVADTKQYLEADVVYYVHLGNWGYSDKGYNDFTVNRNTHYTYNITIKGLHNIQVEVETGVENQSGATGHVYQSKEEIFTFDAHYGQQVFRINAASVDPEGMDWYVKTPFAEGTPKSNSLDKLDYGWVTFMLNKVDGNKYSENNQWYPGDESESLMDVEEFTKFLKEEKVKLSNGQPSAFKKHDGSDCIYVTAFVNEYYYYTNPVNSNENSVGLWKRFVNQPNRLMHILSDTQKSPDGDSSMSGSILTVRQRSIQTPYNLEKEGLVSAFGCETVDETRPYYFTFYENNDPESSKKDLGNNSTNNGLYNTACLWNMFTNEVDDRKWATYLNYEIPNSASTDRVNHFMISSKESMRYSPMSRNRDNNGNGIIDPEEIRWYIAPLEQLYALYVGDLGLSSDAQLYPASLAKLSNDRDEKGKWQWRSHIVCSNQTTISNSSQYISKYWPEMLWAEEGVSISGYGQEWQKQAPNSIRCIRNLGMPDAKASNLADKSANVPTPMIQVSTADDVVYTFDLSNMNARSARYFTTNELVPGDENAESSRIYFGFETNRSFIDYSSGYSTLKTAIESGNSPCTEEGYRLPNVREAALMAFYCPQNWWGNAVIQCCSYYSHGSLGGNLYYDNSTTSWYFRYKYITLSLTPNKLRFVKDLR